MTTLEILEAARAKIADPAHCEWTQVRSSGPLSLEQCDQHRFEFRINDNTIVIAEDEAARAMVFNEFSWMVNMYEDFDDHGYE